jgi:hypothetical protein
MRLEFTALEGGFDDEDGPHFCLMCGVSGRDADGADHYLNFQRGFEDEDPSEDWGVHFEFDDQINGAYNCISRCRLTQTVLEKEAEVRRVFLIVVGAFLGGVLGFRLLLPPEPPPGEYQCGLATLPATFLGFPGGLVVGGLLGFAISGVRARAGASSRAGAGARAGLGTGNTAADGLQKPSGELELDLL